MTAAVLRLFKDYLRINCPEFASHNCTKTGGICYHCSFSNGNGRNEAYKRRKGREGGSKRNNLIASALSEAH